MPEDFERCVRQGGRVRRKTLSGGRYINICYKGGKSYAGEVHHAKGDAGSAVSAKAKGK